jgi:hypothetical protein
VNRSSLSDSAIRALLGLLFVAAFFTLHIRLFPLDAEYQPVLFLLLGIVVAIAGLQGISILNPLLVVGGLMAAGVWHAAHGALDIEALVRCMIGPFFAGIGPLLVRYIPREAFAALVYVHVLIAVGGIFATDQTVDILMRFGLRGAQYGWNTFMASEPSYAALNLVYVVALFALKDQRILSGHLGMLSALILLATTSITGMVFGSLLLAIWVLADWKGISGISKLVGLVVVLVALAFLPLGIGEKLQQVGARLGVISGSLVSLDVLGLFGGEPSGAWRILTNGLAAVGIAYAPIGTGGLGLETVFQMPLEGTSSALIGVILASEVFVGLQTDFIAATPLFNYATFGGLLATIPLLVYVIAAVYRVSRATVDVPCKLLFVFSVLCGLVWQSALTSPGWWLVVGAGAAFGRSKCEGAFRILRSTSR